MNQNTKTFEAVRPEKEIIVKYFKKPEFARPEDSIVYYQATEIKAFIEKITGQKFPINKIGQELKEIGFMQVFKRVDGVIRRVYAVVPILEEGRQVFEDVDAKEKDDFENDELPF